MVYCFLAIKRAECRQSMKVKSYKTGIMNYGDALNQTSFEIVEITFHYFCKLSNTIFFFIFYMLIFVIICIENFVVVAKNNAIL